MHFVDSVKVRVNAGDGGDGMISFRREKFVDHGGPNGGDGGNGGNVIFKADQNLNTLAQFRNNQILEAENGEGGKTAKRHGKNGQDLTVKVPTGTVILNDEGEQLADLTKVGQEEIIARGGKGGFGNAHFTSSTRQAPRFSERGEPGQQFERLGLELKLIADVGLVGLPNAGKSTFLSVVSNARPEIADYPFTTLQPNLGVADIDGESLLIADIPGLIEGASQGKGLGDEFLRHVERTKVLIHLIDAYSNDLVGDYQTIVQELKNYIIDLSGRPQIVAITKVEGLDQEMIADRLSELQPIVPAETPLMAISSHSKAGIIELLRETKSQTEQIKSTQEDTPEEVLVHQLDDKAGERWEVSVENGEYIVSGRKIEKFAARTDFKNAQGVRRLRAIMRKMGIEHELKRRGIKDENLVRIGDQTLKF
ncbi:MAG: GTPase ObgE [Candidatus Saccharimonadales bacterium]|nr:GTPase ObgE [Candidatus Saccharimonadales bacterium]